MAPLSLAPLMMTGSALSAKDIRSRLQDVRQRISASAKRAGRDSNEITLVAVSKTHSAEIVRLAIEAGVADLGENRIQEAEAKIGEVGRDRVRWHLIGHLQANKARKAVGLVDMIHSLDSVALAQRLDRVCGELGREVLPILVQVDLGGEATKSGISEAQLSELVDAVKQSQRLECIGLMTLPPYFEEPERARPYFQRLRELRDQLSSKGAFRGTAGELSMGMTHDFEVAIEEGATMVRVGTAIFGERTRAA